MLLPIKDDVRHTSHFCPLTPGSEQPESEGLNGNHGRLNPPAEFPGSRALQNQNSECLGMKERYYS